VTDIEKNWKLKKPRENTDPEGKQCLITHKGLKKNQCEWKEFYRDCYRECNSKRRDENGFAVNPKEKIVLPIVYFKRDSSSTFFVPDNFKGESSDCSINPYAFEKSKVHCLVYIIHQSAKRKLTNCFTIGGQNIQLYWRRNSIR